MATQIKAITFDCAGTLVQVRWDPAGLAIECAQECGIECDPSEARGRYERLLLGSRLEYAQLNLTQSEKVCDRYWHDLTVNWLKAIGADLALTQPVIDRAYEKLYGRDSEVFTLFEDTLPGIESAINAGYRIAVLSNWDYSLPRVLKHLNLFDRFETVVTSLFEGVEKPDPRIFGIAAQRLSLDASQIAHVGDCPHDDLMGASSSGFRGVLIDRTLTEPEGSRISSLTQLPEVLTCS